MQLPRAAPWKFGRAPAHSDGAELGGWRPERWPGLGSPHSLVRGTTGSVAGDQICFLRRESLAFTPNPVKGASWSPHMCRPGSGTSDFSGRS